MNEGDAVYWTLTGRDGRTIERAGHVVAIIQPEQHPNTAGFGEVVSSSAAVRIDESYLVRLPNSNTVMWPYTNLVLLPEGKEHLLVEQSPVTVRKSCIDKRDRLKLKMLCKSLGHDFNEGTVMLSVPEWGKRFIFSVADGIEYISAVETLRVL